MMPGQAKKVGRMGMGMGKEMRWDDDVDFVCGGVINLPSLLVIQSAETET